MGDYYKIDGHKLLWHLDRIKEWQSDRVVAPIYIEISPVSFCNHSCIFCGVDFAMQKRLQLDSAVLCARLKEIGRLGVRSIMYAGEGEPLLHKDLPEIVRTTKESGIDVAITTNGSLGNARLWEEILPYLTWIKFSVDAGTPEVYAKVHNVPVSAFERTLRSLKDALRIKKERELDTTIGVQFLVIRENYEDIENALELFSSLDIDYLVVKPYSLNPQMRKKREVAYNESVIASLETLVNRYVERLNIIFRKDAMSKYAEQKKHYSHCYALPFWGHVSANGDFYTCSVFLGRDGFRAGNLYHDGMEEIIFGGKRKRSILFGETELDVKEECRVNCRMARINEFLEFLNNKPEHLDFI